MRNFPFDKPGRFWRGNLHTHSTVSDGHKTVEELCALYQDAGYDFLAVTDHFMRNYHFKIADTRPYRAEGFTTIIGAELHPWSTAGGERWHMLSIGLPLDFAPVKDDEDGPSVARRALEAGAFVGIAHPRVYDVTVADALSLGDIHAIEVYNGTNDTYLDKADGWYLLDMLSAGGRIYSALAADDAHFMPDRPGYALGWVMVRSEALEPDALLSALKAGDYYASTGPALHDIRFEGDEIVVESSPVSSVLVSGRGALAARAHGEHLTETRLRFSRLRRGGFLRVTVRDAQGYRAWTGPIPLDEV